MAIRQSDFISGIETSTLPSSGTPVSGGDLVTLAYANDNYTPYQSVGENVADITALKAIPASDRYDEQLRFINGLDIFYQFDSTSVATPDDDNVVQPNAGSGRWIKIEMGGGAGGSGASGIESLMNKLELEKYGLITPDFDNSVGLSGNYRSPETEWVGYLAVDAASGDTVIDAIWNPFPSTSGNNNYSSLTGTTGWTQLNASTSFAATTTAGEFRVGTTGHKLNKDNSATTASIRWDNSTQSMEFKTRPHVVFYVKLTSVTGLASINFRVYKDSTSNFQTYVKTTQWDSSAFMVGWNRIEVNLETDTSSAGGTGWTVNDLSRYYEMEIQTTSSGQTYTGVCFSALWFSARRPERQGVIGNEFTFFDNSVKQSLRFAVSNTRSWGPLTLSAAISAAYQGGNVPSDMTRIERTTLSTGNNQIFFDTSLSSGAISGTQEVRISSILREDVAKNYLVEVDQVPLVSGEFVSITGSTSGTVTGYSSASGELLSGDTIDIFRPVYINSKAYFEYLDTRTLTANATSSSSDLIIPFSATGVQAGDWFSKRFVSDVSFSCVSKTAIENYESLSLISSPDGIQLVGENRRIPQGQFAVSSWQLGGVNDQEATRNKVPNSVVPALTKNGSFGINTSFLRGKYAARFGTSGDAYSLTNANSTGFAGTGFYRISFWFFDAGNTGSFRILAQKSNGASNGFIVRLKNNEDKLNLFIGGSASDASTTYPLNRWNLCVVEFNASTNIHNMYQNGVLVASVNNGIGTSTNTFFIGGDTGGANVPVTMADFTGWVGGTPFTQADHDNMYNSGIYIPVGVDNLFLHKLTYEKNGANGQKLTIKPTLSRRSSAFNPGIWKVGAI